jgi:pimeloyl-ACP methyl ester carboxylesterase
MLPGTLCDARVFSRQKRALRQVAKVVVVDYRQLARHARDKLGSEGLRRLLASLPDKFSVAGFSLGGIYALEMLRQAPERIERLAMIASNARAASAKGYRQSVQTRRLWQRRSGGGPEAVVKRNLSNYFHHEASRQKHAPLIRSMAANTSSAVAFEQFLWAGTRPDGLQLLSEFPGPVLIVSGEKDVLCPPPWQAAMLSAQPHASWISLPRVGHFVPLEAPTKLTSALARWLQT